MISKNKIIALILGGSLASSATYGSYAYFNGEYSVENTIKIVDLDPNESPFEVLNISTRENSIVLEFSKKVFYSGSDINKDIIGSETFLDNVEISIDGKEIIISKKDGSFLIPVGIENNLPSIKLNSNFEDRFGKRLEEIILYLYEDSNGSVAYSLTNTNNKSDNMTKPNNEVNENEVNNSNDKVDKVNSPNNNENKLTKPNNENDKVNKPNNEPSVESYNNESQNFETSNSEKNNNKHSAGENSLKEGNLEEEKLNENELNKLLGE